MRILIDINHPAHVHLFRNLAKEIQDQGHEVLFTTRTKEIAHVLLEAYGLRYRCLGPHYKSLWAKLYGILKYDLLILREAMVFKPDLFLSMGSIYASHVAFMMRKPHILLQDTENAKLQNMLSLPFATVILNPRCYSPNLGPKQFRYDGYHELAYLHPNRFKPDPQILRELGVSSGEHYSILRFVSWNANHDIAHQGLTKENKVKAAKEFGRYGKVFITSEGTLPDELRHLAVKIAPERIHHAIAYASLLYGESATMASESAMLGVPAIFLDNDGRGYTTEQEKTYGMVFNFSESPEEQSKSIERGIEVLSDAIPATSWSKGRAAILADMMDVTAFLKWLILGYPGTMTELRDNPELIQARFKPLGKPEGD